MNREDLSELHSIQPIENVPSILELGILSHVQAQQVDHADIAAEEIQDRRECRRVPGGRPLHQYANLYFHARNPMMSVRRDRHARLCVLRISCEVLDLPDVVVSDQNASSDYVRFEAAAEGLDFIPADLVFAPDWRDPDGRVYWRKKSAKCAEVLVPGRVPPRFITGAYTCGHGSRALSQVAPTLDIEIDGDLFFCE